ncbi:MAG: lipid-A-disaccharide synthase [Paludibacter sp.]|nr:lipid-A-disaccharide synthase [Bacteroidales bacterium]MCM1068754.1 lipid-A-disaccharide synthase [Prevotella sp.]MCM1354466.1 lipid-A-disaccharide synthase [Bacteroides sp.]MCM1443269.1 lipid-A-disaccharide synthase [Muribaculum sp.]MCM1481046.1 lipid-A-disaccharide synthase [Paludibacter sp.]
MPINYFVIAGEASGDLHAGNLIEAIKHMQPHAQFVGMGGDHMQEAGCRLIQHYRNMAFMGIVAVVRNLDKVHRNFQIAQQALLDNHPDALILIDYPTFNLKIAQFCRKHLPDTKIYYYIPPKIWAWKTWRVHKIARYADRILGIFPFEPSFYQQYGYQAEYVGNPTMDSVRQYLTHTAANNPATDRPIIAILPGSRQHEISQCLPRMLEAARRIKGYDIVVSGAPGIDPQFYKNYLQDETIVFGQTYQLLTQAKAAVVNSGTATLETALLRCPQVAVYHIVCGRLVGLIKDFLFKIPHFTLVNIIAQKEVIRELLAYLFTVDNVETELRRLLDDSEYRTQMLSNYEEIRCTLGDTPAADNAARIIIQATV